MSWDLKCILFLMTINVSLMDTESFKLFSFSSLSIFKNAKNNSAPSFLQNLMHRSSDPDTKVLYAASKRSGGDWSMDSWGPHDMKMSGGCHCDCDDKDPKVKLIAVQKLIKVPKIKIHGEYNEQLLLLANCNTFDRLREERGLGSLRQNGGHGHVQIR